MNRKDESMIKKLNAIIVIATVLFMSAAPAVAEDAPFPVGRDTEDSMVITEDDKESETVIPKDYSISPDVWGETEYSFHEPEDDEMDLEGDIKFSFDKPKIFPCGFKVSWKTNGTRYFVKVYDGAKCIYNRLHGDKYDPDIKGKKYVSMKNMFPGKTYKVEVISEQEVWYDDYDYETYQSNPMTIKITIPKSTKGMNIFKTKKQAAASLYKAIKAKKKVYELYILRTKKVTAKEIFEAATTEKKLGDYLKNNMNYNMERSATRVMDGEKESVIINGKKYYRFTYKMGHYTSVKQEKVFEKALSKAVKKAGVKKNMSNEKKAKKIYKWISKKVRFSKKSGKYNKTAYGALVKGKANCRGVSALYYRMLRTAGVRARILTGQGHTGRMGELHAMNLVKVGKRYYYYDLTTKTYKARKKSMKIWKFDFLPEAKMIIKLHKAL